SSAAWAGSSRRARPGPAPPIPTTTCTWAPSRSARRTTSATASAAYGSSRDEQVRAGLWLGVALLDARVGLVAHGAPDLVFALAVVAVGDHAVHQHQHQHQRIAVEVVRLGGG